MKMDLYSIFWLRDWRRRIKAGYRLAVALVLLTGTAGCGSVSQIYENDMLPPAPWRSVIVFGIATKGYDARLQIQKYLLEEQTFPSACFSLSKFWVEAWAVDWPHVRYVALSVPAGHYVFGDFGMGRFPPDIRRTVVTAPASKMVYLGDFIASRMSFGEMRENMIRKGKWNDRLERFELYHSDRYIEVRQNLERAREAMKRFPQLKDKNLEAAETIEVESDVANIFNNCFVL